MGELDGLLMGLHARRGISAVATRRLAAKS